MTALGKKMISNARKTRARLEAGGKLRVHKPAMKRDEFLSQYREFLTKGYGDPCPDVCPGCPTCAAWALYNAVAMSIVEDDKAEQAVKAFEEGR
jgi:hypothetical protein